MQRFPCPFCGLRPETEFHFAAEAGKQRPARDSSDEDWASYLYFNDAPRGTAPEVWVHLTCGEFFAMTRDTITREVTRAEALPGRET
jgi:sarcosine oxidase subunit delta